MPETFQYKVKDKSGKLVEGSLEAENAQLVVSKLRSMGYVPIEIQQQGGTNLQLYVDGSLSGAATISARPGFTATAVVGWSEATWLTKYSGLLDEVALYSTALSASRVNAHYAVGSGRAPAPAHLSERQVCSRGLPSRGGARPSGSLSRRRS